jgi:heme o synthase
MASPFVATVDRVAPADLLALTKPRIVALVVLTAAAGYAMALPFVALAVPRGTAEAWWLLGHALFGTALVAGGTSALNQVLERDVDARMRRTAARPLPAGRLGVAEATVFAWALAVLGLVELLLFVNALTALLAAATLLSYVFVYTPLKRRTHLATLIGAVPGALPIVGGWAAAGGTLDARAGSLFAILFLWQLPHFLALAWLYREDYARAGLHMLSVDDPGGAVTFRQAALNAVALVPATLVPVAQGMAHPAFAVAALALGAWLVARAVRAAREPTPKHARRLFTATLAYLPLLLGLLLLFRVS